MNFVISFISVFMIISETLGFCQECNNLSRYCSACDGIEYLGYCIKSCPSGYTNTGFSCEFELSCLMESTFYSSSADEINLTWKPSYNSLYFDIYKNRGLYLKNSVISTIRSYTFLNNFSMIMWINAFDSGEIMVGPNFKVGIEHSMITYEFNVIDHQDCGTQFKKMTSKFAKGWIQINFSLIQNFDNRLDVIQNGYIYSNPNASFYWILENFSLLSFNGFIGKFSVFNTMAWD